jgi:hypothetical protein
MSSTFQFSGENGHIAITALGYEREDVDNEDDANWLAAVVSVDVPPFAGEFKAALQTDELALLRDMLQAPLQSLSGRVDFENTEEDLRIELTFASRGSVLITGTAKPHRHPGTQLHFRIQSDQSAINLASQDLSSLLRLFPARGRR